MGASGGGGTANLYVQDGLIAMFDGIENAGAGKHSNSATTWKDLSGNGWDLTMAGGGSSSWQDDHFNFVPVSGTNGMRFTVDATDMDNVLTLEFCFETAGTTNLLHFRNNFVWVLDSRYGGFAYKWINTSSASRSFPVGKASASIDIANNDMYRNNIQCASVLNGRMVTTDNSLLCIGCVVNNGFRSYTSFKLHTIRLYNRLLTADERTHNYELDVQRFGLETT